MVKLQGFYWQPTEDGSEKQLKLFTDTGANTVFISHHLLSKAPVESLRDHNLQLYVDWALFAGEQLRQRFPDAFPLDAEGLPFERDGWYVPLCPNNPQVRSFHLGAIANLLDQYSGLFAGLWLDFIRYPVRWEVKEPELRPFCFCRHCLNLFLEDDRESYTKEETARLASSILLERHEEWVEWKCKRIAHFVAEIKAQITVADWPLRLGMFVLPWRRTDYEGAIREVAGQDLELLASSIDTFSPMVYHKLCYQPASWIESVVRDHADRTHSSVLPIVQAVHQPDTMTPEQLDAALAYAFASAPEGAMIFTLDPVLASTELAGIVRNRFTGQAT